MGLPANPQKTAPDAPFAKICDAWEMKMTTAKNARDLLYGLAAIADHLGLTVPQLKPAISRGDVPTFKMGRIVCASKSYLAEHFRKPSEGQ